ncbi:MAG: trimethylamine methyltransferase family protein [Clostridia bacterium]|nr:trimethylamine methyltransferase family protein [Clostridia bacterium]
MFWDRCSNSSQVDNASIQFSVLSRNQCERIFSAALEVLERTGTKIYNEEALALLKKAGCRVDGERVWIQSRLVEGAVRTAPSRVTLVRPERQTKL